MSEWSEKVARNRGGYFKVTDLEETPGHELTLTIAYLAENQSVGGQDKDVVFFEDDGRKLVLNQPNSEACLAILGDEPVNWPGKVITLHLETYLDRQAGTDKQRVAVKAPPGTQTSGNGSNHTTPKPRPFTTAPKLDDEVPF